MLRYQKTAENGDFVACGTGLRYEYDHQKHALRVSTLSAEAGLYTLLCPPRSKAEPEFLVYALEKASCIKALLLSNNETANLAQTMSVDRLKPVLHNVYELAIQSYDLRYCHFESFTSRKLHSYALEDFQLKYMQCTRSGTAYFRMFIKVNEVQDCVIRDTELDVLLAKSAKTIVRDLIPQVLSSSSRDMADKLLLLSSRLSVLGRILNENYNPELQVKNSEKISKHAQTSL